MQFSLPNLKPKYEFVHETGNSVVLEFFEHGASIVQYFVLFGRDILRLSDRRVDKEAFYRLLFNGFHLNYAGTDHEIFVTIMEL